MERGPEELSVRQIGFHGRFEGQLMLDRTRKLWDKQNQHDGDRQRLFSRIADSLSATSVLYPGSYVDLAPSFVWPSVTYVDMDARAESGRGVAYTKPAFAYIFERLC